MRRFGCCWYIHFFYCHIRACLHHPIGFSVFCFLFAFPSDSNGMLAVPSVYENVCMYVCMYGCMDVCMLCVFVCLLSGRYGYAGATSPLGDGACAAGRYGIGGSSTNLCTGPCA